MGRQVIVDWIETDSVFCSVGREVIVDWIVTDSVFCSVDIEVIVDWIVADSVFRGTSLSVGGKDTTMSVREEGRRCRECGAMVGEGKGATLRSVDEVYRCSVSAGMVGVCVRTSEV